MKIPHSTEEFFEHVMAEEPAEFWKTFHTERGHHIVNIPEWSPFSEVDEINEPLATIASNALYNYKNDGILEFYHKNINFSRISMALSC